MACITGGVGGNVQSMFAGCLLTVMTTRAGSGCDGAVIEHRRYPGVCSMTIITLIVAGKVQCMLTPARDPVVATRARTQYLCVIHVEHGCPEINTVAVFTGACGLEMLRRFAGGLLSIMAGNTTAGDGGVVESGRDPGFTDVA